MLQSMLASDEALDEALARHLQRPSNPDRFQTVSLGRSHLDTSHPASSSFERSTLERSQPVQRGPEEGEDSGSDESDPYVEEVDDGRQSVDGQMAARKIHVEVCEARNLMAKGADGSSDPFCILEFDGKQKRTSTKVDDLNPKWNEEFTFSVAHADAAPKKAAAKQETLEISVYSRSRTRKRNGFLGRVKVPVSLYGESEGIDPRGQEKLVWYPLDKRSLLSKVSGVIGLKLWYEDLGGDDDTDSVDSTGGVEAHPEHSGEEEGGSVAVHEKDKPRGGIQQQGDVAHIVRGVHSAFDLVDQVEYLFVRVVRARSLLAADSNGTSDPYVKIHVGNRSAQTKVVKHELNPEWNEVFAFNKAPGSQGDNNHIDRENGVLELNVWDEDFLTADDFLGQVEIPLYSVPTRVYNEKPVDPQWYRLERRTLKEQVKGVHSGAPLATAIHAGLAQLSQRRATMKRSASHPKGDIMVAVWFGTQADEAFASSWQSDTGGLSHFRSKQYATPRLWYLRVTVLEAENLIATDKGMSDPFVKLKLGSTQEARTKPQPSTLNPVWNEDVFFVVAEPFDEPLLLTVADFNPYSANDFLGQISIPLESIETRITNREVGSRWYALDRAENRRTVTGRLHLRLVFEGGYHVNDGSIAHNSDSRPTAKQLWTAPIATLELGIIGAAGLPIMKTNTTSGGGTTDAYVVARHGKKWVRTRTVKDDTHPLWNEQYTWDVHEPSTVLTIGVFDNQHTRNSALEKARSYKDKPMGKVRIRLSTLEGNKVYRGSFPLYLLGKKGVTPMGSLDLAIRFTYPSAIPLLKQYLKPVLPAMHYFDPIDTDAAEKLRIAAMNLVADRLERYDPPMRREVVEYMLDTDEMLFTMRRMRANWNRIKAVFAGIPWFLQFFNRVCQWKSPPLTVFVHSVYIFMVLRPHFILPTVLSAVVARGAFYYQHRSRGPASMDPRLSGGEEPEDDVDDDEEETQVGQEDTKLSLIQNPYRNYKILKSKFDKMKGYAALVQNILGQIAAQGERLAALLEWRDPRASMAFCSVCLVLAVFLFFSPIRYVAIFVGCFVMRHPRFRDPLPPAPVNLFLRLPSLEDRII